MSPFAAVGLVATIAGAVALVRFWAVISAALIALYTALVRHRAKNIRARGMVSIAKRSTRKNPTDTKHHIELLKQLNREPADVDPSTG